MLVSLLLRWAFGRTDGVGLPAIMLAAGASEPDGEVTVQTIGFQLP